MEKNEYSEIVRGLKAFKRQGVIFANNSQPDFTSFYFEIDNENKILKEMLSKENITLITPDENTFSAIELRQYKDTNIEPEINYCTFERKNDDNYWDSEPETTQPLNESNKDKELKEYLKSRAQTYSMVLSAQSEEMDFHINHAYSLVEELRGNKYFLEKYNKSFSKLEEYQKDDEILNLWDEIKENHKKNGTLSAKGYELFRKNKEDIFITGIGLETLIKAKDIFDYHNEALNFKRPSASEIRRGLEEGWSFDVITKGYQLTDINGITCIERNDAMQTFRNDEEAAKQYTKDTNIRMLEENKEVFTKGTYLERHMIPSTSKTLFDLSKNGFSTKNKEKENNMNENDKTLFENFEDEIMLEKRDQKNFQKSLDELADSHIEQMDANGGMSELAMENEIKYEKPDFLDDEDEYDDGQIALEVVDKKQMLYFNSDKVAANQYIIRIDEGLFKELAPKQYSKTKFDENEIPAITYRQSTDPDVPSQFLISKFEKDDYGFPIIQTTIEITDAELLKQIKAEIDWYEKNTKENENMDFIPTDEELDRYLDEISDPKFDEKLSKFIEEEQNRQMSAEKQYSMEIEKYSANQILQKLPEELRNTILEEENKMNCTPTSVFNNKENSSEYIVVEKRDDDAWQTHLFMYNERDGEGISLSTGHYDFKSQEEAEKDAISRVLNQTNILTMFTKNTDYNLDNTNVTVNDHSRYDIKNLTKKEIFAIAYAEKTMPELRKEFTEEFHKEFPMLKNTNEKPSINFIAKTIEKRPEIIDTTNKYIEDMINLVNKNPSQLNMFQRNTQFWVEQSYENYINSNDKTVMQKIYESKIESLRKQEEEQTKKLNEISAKEKELEKRENKLKIQEKTLDEKQARMNEFMSTFNHALNKDGPFKDTKEINFKGLSQEQVNDIWKTASVLADKFRNENQSQSKNKENKEERKNDAGMKGNKNSGSHGSKR